jgi:Invasin, domain 3
MKLLNSLKFIILFSLMMAVVISCVPIKKDETVSNPNKLSLPLSEINNPQVAVGNTVVVTLKAKKRDGSSHNESSTVTFKHLGGTSRGTFGVITYNGGGIYTTSFTGTLPGTATTIFAYINGEEVAASAKVVVTNGSVSLANSTLTASATTLISNNSMTVTLTARDTSNTQFPSGGLNIVFSHTNGTSTGTFSAVTDNQNGTYTTTFTGITSGTATDLKATIAGSFITSSTPSVTVNAGPMNRLGFVTQPTVTPSESIIPTVKVAAQDVNGNTVSTYSGTVTMGIDLGNNPGGGTLSGTLTKAFVSGEALFNDLSINYFGSGYKLEAISGIYSKASASFDVTAQSINTSWPFTAMTTTDYVQATGIKWNSLEELLDFQQLSTLIIQQLKQVIQQSVMELKMV